MKKKSNIVYSVPIALTFVIFSYTMLGLLSMLSFGIVNIAPSIFENIQYDNSWFSIILRCIFMLIFICNIPFIFFPGKQSILSIIELCGCCKQKRTHEMEDGEFYMDEDDNDMDLKLNESFNGDANNENDNLQRGHKS